MVVDITAVLPDIPRLYTALAEWLSCLICLLGIRRRFRGWRFAGLCAAFGLLQAAFLTLTDDMEGIFWVLCMAVAVGIMYGYLLVCGSAGLMGTGYYCVRSFVIAEFAASLEWQTYCYLMIYQGMSGIFFRLFWLVFVYAAVYGIIWLLYRRYDGTQDQDSVNAREMISYIIIGLAVFLMSNMGFLSSNTIFGGTYSQDIFNVRTLVDLGGVAIMYAYHVQRVELRMRHDLESVQNILQNQYAQYEQSKEVVELINYKYHDLKHHIIALRAEQDEQKRNEYLDQLEEGLNVYEGQIHTGNNVLDTLLTSVNLRCQKDGIVMTCVLDGDMFAFMDVVDICSIFGNALDNAIECEKQIADPEKRLIRLRAFYQKTFLILQIENCYEGELQLEGSLPKTTKKEKEFHGYGLRSMQYTVHKYGGELNISAKDGWFMLKILIPRGEPEQE